VRSSAPKRRVVIRILDEKKGRGRGRELKVNLKRGRLLSFLWDLGANADKLSQEKTSLLLQALSLTHLSCINTLSVGFAFVNTSSQTQPIRHSLPSPRPRSFSFPPSPSMVLFFTSTATSPPSLVYMGKDKVESSFHLPPPCLLQLPFDSSAELTLPSLLSFLSQTKSSFASDSRTTSGFTLIRCESQYPSILYFLAFVRSRVP